MNIFHAYFSTGQVVAATGVSNPTLQSWLKRGIVIAQRPEGAETEAGITGGGTPGAHRRFSFFNVMEIAIAKALIDAGLGNLEFAFRAAQSYAHFGGEASSKEHPGRIPGCPYDPAGKAATTLVAVRGERSAVILYEVKRDILPIIWTEIGSREGHVQADAGLVFDRVVTALGFDPAAVLAMAYDRKGGS